MPTLALCRLRRTAPAGAAAAAVAASALGLGAGPAAAAPAPAAAPVLAPLTASVLAPPRPVDGTDGRRHLVYELRLGNTDAVQLEIASLAVRGGGRTLLRAGAAEVPAIMSTATGPASGLAPGGSATVWLDLALPRAGRMPRLLVHSFRVRATLPDGSFRAFALDAAPTRVVRRRTPALAPPLRGGPFLNFNGCCAPGPHRTALTAVDGVPYLSQRFATDFIRIDAQGTGGAGDLSKNESFFTYGEPVYAVAAGRVVAARNDLPDNVPLNEPPGSAFTAQTIVGNTVVLRLADGRYAAYGHLRPGSVRVRAGQRVRPGQMLARVGNTGQSGAAHLHLQLMDGPSPLAADGLPFTFRRFRLLGAAANVGEFLTGAAPADVRPVGGPAMRRGELPLQATVVRFPG